MKSFVISKRDAGTRVDRFIEKTFESVPKSLMYKEIRKKNIKVNKKRCTNDQKLNEGDLLELYLKDDVLKLKVKHLDFMKASDELDIVYEDENVIIINKKVGILCHPDGKEYIDNLVGRLKRQALLRHLPTGLTETQAVLCSVLKILKHLKFSMQRLNQERLKSIT